MPSAIRMQLIELQRLLDQPVRDWEAIDKAWEVIRDLGKAVTEPSMSANYASGPSLTA